MFLLSKLDIDECMVDKTACDSNQNCINTPGSFRCECKMGFTMDKVVNACVGELSQKSIQMHETRNE